MSESVLKMKSTSRRLAKKTAKTIEVKSISFLDLCGETRQMAFGICVSLYTLWKESSRWPSR